MLEKILFKKIEVWAPLLVIFFIVVSSWIFSAIVKSTASGGVQFGGLGRIAVEIADFPLAAGRVLFGVGSITTDRESDIPDWLTIHNPF